MRTTGSTDHDGYPPRVGCQSIFTCLDVGGSSIKVSALLSYGADGTLGKTTALCNWLHWQEEDFKSVCNGIQAPSMVNERHRASSRSQETNSWDKASSTMALLSLNWVGDVSTWSGETTGSTGHDCNGWNQLCSGVASSSVTTPVPK